MSKGRRTCRTAFCLMLLTFIALAAGCGLFRARPAPELPKSGVLEVLRERADRLSTVTDTSIRLSIRVSTPDGTERMPTLSGVLAFDIVRLGLWLRAEKLGREVFDLRALGDTFWLAVPDTSEIIVGGPVAYARLPGYFMRPADLAGLLAGPEFLGLSWSDTTMTVDRHDYRFDVSLLGAPYRRVLVDRRDLVVSRITRYDPVGRVTLDVELSRHTESELGSFPRELVVRRPREGVTVSLRLRDPKLNKDIPLQAFRPSTRPGYTVHNLDYEPIENIEFFGGQA